jgi:hypothetical protein
LKFDFILKTKANPQENLKHNLLILSLSQGALIHYAKLSVAALL